MLTCEVPPQIRDRLWDGSITRPVPSHPRLLPSFYLLGEMLRVKFSNTGFIPQPCESEELLE